MLFLLVLYGAFGQLVPKDSGSGERLSLQDAIILALNNNPELLRAQKEIDAASGRALQAGRIPNPEIQFGWNETPLNFNLGDADEEDIGIVQQIEFPTKRSNRISVATYDREIAELQVERVKVTITARVKKAYHNLLFSERLVGHLQEQAKLLKDFLDIANGRLRAGTGTYLDVIRAKVELTRLNNDLVEAQRDVRARRVQLNLLLGQNPDQVFELTDSLSYSPLTVERDTLLQRLLAQSATVKLAQRSVVRQQSALSLAKTSYLPDFTLGLFHQRRAEEPPFNANQFTGTTSRSLGIQLGLSIPLWFWQEPKGLVQEASAGVTVAELNLLATQRRIRANLLNAFDLVEVAETQVKVFDTTLLDDAEDILKTGIAQYQNNQIDALNLIDVYRTYRATKVEYARALLNYANAVADLEASAELQFEDQ